MNVETIFALILIPSVLIIDTSPNPRALSPSLPPQHAHFPYYSERPPFQRTPHNRRRKAGSQPKETGSGLFPLCIEFFPPRFSIRSDRIPPSCQFSMGHIPPSLTSEHNPPQAPSFKSIWHTTSTILPLPFNTPYIHSSGKAFFPSCLATNSAIFISKPIFLAIS